MKKKNHKMIIIIALVTLVGLFIARKQVKSAICGVHKFSFCEAAPAFSFQGPVGPPDILGTYGKILGGQLKGNKDENIFNQSSGHGGTKGTNCSAKDAMRGKCVSGI